MRSRVLLHSMRTAGLACLGFGLLVGCASNAPKDRPPVEIQAQKLKSSQNACIRLRQAEEEAIKSGLADASGYREAKERACQQYEKDKQELERLQLETPAFPAKSHQP